MHEASVVKACDVADDVPACVFVAETIWGIDLTAHIAGEEVCGRQIDAFVEEGGVDPVGELLECAWASAPACRLVLRLWTSSTMTSDAPRLRRTVTICSVISGAAERRLVGRESQSAKDCMSIFGVVAGGTTV